MDNDVRLTTELQIGIEEFNKLKSTIKLKTGEEPNMAAFLAGWLRGGILEDVVLPE